MYYCAMPSPFRFPPEYILFDLEFTSWEGSLQRNWSGENEHREIIQIGAIRVRSETLKETDSFLEYVRPILNPQLSDFITELTGITQEDIEARGVSFPDALARFVAFVGTTPAYCWGRDTEVFLENCALNAIEFPIPLTQCADLRPLVREQFAAAGVHIEEYTSGTLIQALSTSPTRRAHDALNDMRNLLDALRELQKRQL